MQALCGTEFINIPMTDFPAELTWNTDAKRNVKLNTWLPQEGWWENG